MQEATLMNIDVGLIDPNPEQPRAYFEPVALQALADSIVAHGLEQAITVEMLDSGRYLLRDGERRLKAHKLAGLETIMAIVKLPPGENVNRERLIGAFVANFQRQPLNPVEEAKALKRMNEDLGMSYQEIASQLGMKKPTVANKIRLLGLPGEWLDAVIAGLVSERQAAALLPYVSLADDMKEKITTSIAGLWDEIIREGKSSEQIRRDLAWIIQRNGQAVSSAVFFDMPFDADGVHHETCAGCPFIITTGGTALEMCGSPMCFARKTALFHATAAAVVQERYGLPVLPLGVEIYQVESFYAFGPEDLQFILDNSCGNLAGLVNTWERSIRLELSKGVALVCSKKGCGCARRLEKLKKGEANGVEKRPLSAPPVLKIHFDKYGLVLERDREKIQLSATDVWTVVEGFCAQMGIDPGVLRANRSDDPPPAPSQKPPERVNTLTDEVMDFCRFWQDSKGRTWKDITNPSHTNGVFWEAIKKDFDKHNILYKGESALKFAIKQAFAKMKKEAKNG